MIKKIKRKLKKRFGPEVLKKMAVLGAEKPRIVKVSETKLWNLEGDEYFEFFEKLNEIKLDIFADFCKTDKVLIKINLNTALPYPASTNLNALEVVVDLLISMGITNIIVGDCASNSALPTRKVFIKKKITGRLNHKVGYSCFDEGEWVKVNIEGLFLKDVVVPKIIYDVDKIIYLANVKSHRLADFSMSMKLAVGFMHPLQRVPLHKSNLQEKVAELSLAVQPDLIILDGMFPFISGGPNKGKVVKGNHMIIGNKLLEVDLAGYDYLYQLRKENNCLEQFEEDPFHMRQFKHYKKIFNR